MNINLNYKTSTGKDIFVLRLNGELPIFDDIGDADFVEFFEFCIKHNLVEFMVQREWRGSPALFRVLTSFCFRVEKFLELPYNMSRAIVYCEKGDMIELTELLESTDYRLIQDDAERRHVIRVDIPTDGKRYKAYKKFDYEM